jgi:hypothetical protein
MKTNKNWEEGNRERMAKPSLHGFYSNVWLCHDGGSAIVYVDTEKKELTIVCFDGVGRSQILIDYQLNVHFLKDKQLIRYWDKEKSEIDNCLDIADHFCSILCYYKNDRQFYAPQNTEQELTGFEKELALLKGYVMRGEDYSEEEFAQKYPKVAEMTKAETTNSK